MSLLLELAANVSSRTVPTAQDDIGNISMADLTVSSFAGVLNVSLSVTALMDRVALEANESFTLNIEIVGDTFPTGILEGRGTYTVFTLEVFIRDTESK